MKKMILSLLVAVLSVASVNAQETRKPIYWIDGKQVENFDGTQLVGKTIVSYTIETKHNIHAIITSDLAGGKDVESVKVFSTMKVNKTDTPVASGITTNVIRADAEEIVYILDGKIVPYSEIESLSSSRIDNMTVIKDKGSSVFMKYAKEYKKTSKAEPKCVILITTKK